MTQPGGDADFTAFATAARPPLARTAWLLTGSRQAAEDLVQDALVRTYVAWPRVRRDDALSFARAVLVNRHIDQWRRAGRELAAWRRRGTDPEVAPDSPHDLGDDRDEIVRAMRRLRPRERAIVVLRYYVDLTEAQVARELGISVGTVKSTASRALAKLRASADAIPDLDVPTVTRPATADPQPAVFPTRAALGAAAQPRRRA